MLVNNPQAIVLLKAGRRLRVISHVYISFESKKAYPRLYSLR